MRHLIDTTDISVKEIDQILTTALDIIETLWKMVHQPKYHLP